MRDVSTHEHHLTSNSINQHQPVSVNHPLWFNGDCDRTPWVFTHQSKIFVWLFTRFSHGFSHALTHGCSASKRRTQHVWDLGLFEPRTVSPSSIFWILTTVLGMASFPWSNCRHCAKSHSLIIDRAGDSPTVGWL